MRALTSKHLSETQVILSYVAFIIGRGYREAAVNDSSPFVKKICSKLVEFENKKNAGIIGSYDSLYQHFDPKDIEFMRNALKGAKFGNYEAGYVAGIFGYSAF